MTRLARFIQVQVAGSPDTRLGTAKERHGSIPISVTRSPDAQVRNGDGERRPPVPDVRQALLHLFLEVPRKDENVVGSGLVEEVFRDDGDPTPGKVPTLLGRILVDYEP